MSFREGFNPSAFPDWAYFLAQWEKTLTALDEKAASEEERLQAAETLANDLKTFVNTYFVNLDVQQEISDKIDNLVASGRFLQIADPAIATTVTDWLIDNITQPEGVVIDATLTVTGACADAKAVGDALHTIEPLNKPYAPFVATQNHGGMVFGYKLYAGNTYRFSNQGTDTITVSVNTTSGSTNVGTVLGGQYRDYVVPIDGNLRIYANGDTSVVQVDNISGVHYNSVANTARLDNIILDPSLSTAGRYAEAKATGDAIAVFAPLNKGFAPLSLTVNRGGTISTYPVYAGNTYRFANQGTATVTMSVNNASGNTNIGAVVAGNTEEYPVTVDGYLRLYANADNTTVLVYNLSGVHYTAEKSAKEVAALKGETVTAPGGVAYSGNGVVITPNTEQTAWTINGTASTQFNYDMYEAYRDFPAGITPGRKYYVETPTHEGLTAWVAHRTGGAWVSTRLKRGYVNIPAEAEGLKTRFVIEQGATFANDVFYLRITPVDSVAFSRLGDNVTPPPMLTIIDDDGHKRFTQYLLPIVQDMHVPITSANVGTMADGEGHLHNVMEWDEIVNCAKAGAEIISHTYSDLEPADIPGLTDQQIVADFRKNRNAMRLHGMTTDGVVFTHGTSTIDRVRDAAKLAGHKYGFAIGSGFINFKGGIDPFYIERFATDSILLDRDRLIARVNRLVTEGTGWMVWMIHTSFTDWGNTSLANTMVTNIRAAISHAIDNGVKIVSCEGGAAEYLGI